MPRKTLGIQSSSKGLLGGVALKLLSYDAILMDHLPVPSDSSSETELVRRLVEITESVLVVEKDTVFQRLQQSDWF